MRSIFSRLMTSYIAVITVTLITVGLLVSYLFRVQVVESKRRELLIKGDAVIDLIQPLLEEGHTPPLETMTVVSDLVGATVWMTDANGRLLAGAPPERWRQRFPEKHLDIQNLFAGKAQSWVRNSRRQADPSIVVGLPLQVSGTPAAVFLYTPITGVNKVSEVLDRLLFYSLLMGLAAALLLGGILSQSLTLPLSRMSHVAREFATGRFEHRAKASGGTEIAELGKALNFMADSLENIEQNRREFLANVSHELKTPVTCIQAMAETLQDGLAPSPEHQARYLNNIVQETHYISRLIHDLLDLAQLEAGELTFASKEISLSDFLKNETEKFSLLLTEKQLVLETVLAPGLPRVLADPIRLSQILANLISNAIRYSPIGGRIEISAALHGTQVMVAVKDHGPGIPEDELPLIWDRFYRVDKSRARNAGGTGLGLAITRKLVRLMGGDVTVESTPGQGAVFSFTLLVALGGRNQ